MNDSNANFSEFFMYSGLNILLLFAMTCLSAKFVSIVLSIISELKDF